jgi:hypothetical protein
MLNLLSVMFFPFWLVGFAVWSALGAGILSAIGLPDFIAVIGGVLIGAKVMGGPNA